MGRAKVAALVAIVAVLSVTLVISSRRSATDVASRGSPAATGGPIPPMPRARSRPSSRPAVTHDPRFDPPPPLQMPYYDTNAGFWLQANGPWVGLGGYFGQSCVFDFCGVGVRVRYADTRTGVDVGRADPLASSVRIRGDTLRDVKASWRSAFPDATFEAIHLDGGPAIEAMSTMATGHAVFAIRAGRLFMISGSSILGPDVRPVLQAFLDGFHFMPAGCWMEPCRDEGWWAKPNALVSFDPDRAPGTWLPAGATWVGLAGPGDRSIQSFWRGRCIDNLCPGYVSVTVGTAATGPVVSDTLDDGRPVWTRASGTTLDEVAASTAEAVRATTVERIRVDGVPARHLVAAHRELVILANRGRFIVITSFDGFLAADARQTLADFLAGFAVEP